ncbi:hypothetical protein SANTM175S_09530 [Streptomyces antimycoticus]
MGQAPLAYRLARFRVPGYRLAPGYPLAKDRFIGAEQNMPHGDATGRETTEDLIPVFLSGRTIATTSGPPTSAISAAPVSTTSRRQEGRSW